MLDLWQVTFASGARMLDLSQVTFANGARMLDLSQVTSASGARMLDLSQGTFASGTRILDLSQGTFASGTRMLDLSQGTSRQQRQTKKEKNKVLKRRRLNPTGPQREAAASKQQQHQVTASINSLSQVSFASGARMLHLSHVT